MPYADEHSCRLMPPAEFEEFRRQNNFRQIDGKRVDAIWGLRNGGSELQAVRYPKDVWTSADARSHCSAQNGLLFEPASGPQIREGNMTHVSKFVRPEVKILDKAAGVISAVVSTESMDRDGDIIRQGYWDLEHFKSHPILLSSHNYRGLTNQIGHWNNMAVQDNKLVGEAQYYLKAGNQEADWGFVLASKGMAAFSVGFVPDMSKAKQIEANGNLSYEFNGQELLEVSQVTVPSNADALQSFKAFGLHPELDQMVTEMLQEIKVDEVVEEVVDEKPIVQPDFDYRLLAEELFHHIKSELRVLAHEQQHNEITRVQAPLPDVNDIVRNVIDSYKEGR
jgi:hypothetical protein